MKLVRIFEEFLEKGIVRRVSPDKQRAENLRLESERKYLVLNKKIGAIGIDSTTANDYIEDCYNILLFLIRAGMLEAGYNSSGVGAHEAEVAFARTMGLTEADVIHLDELRYFRNGVLYYGKRLDTEYCEKVIAFMKRVRSTLADSRVSV